MQPKKSSKESEVSAFRELVFNPAVTDRCTKYLYKLGVDRFSGLKAISPKAGFIRLLQRKRVRLPAEAQIAVVDLLAMKELDPFVRLWVALQPVALSTKVLRRFAGSLAALAYIPLRDFPSAFRAIRAVEKNNFGLVCRHIKNTEKEMTMNLCRMLDSREQALLRAFKATALRDPYDAVMGTLGWIIEAHPIYEVGEGRMMAVCSRRLQKICCQLMDGLEA